MKTDRNTLGRLRALLRAAGAVLGVAALSACASVSEETEVARAPNIIILFADDLGWNDISAHGGALIDTPNIDAIAEGGARFAQSYASSPVCATSRAGLLTGRYQQRFGMETNPSSPRFARAAAELGESGGTFLVHPEGDGPPMAERGLPSGEVTLAETLRAAGYRTGLFGKWHLGAASGLRPEDQGFDVHVGFYAGASLFAPEGADDIVNATLPWSGVDQILWRALPYSLVRNGEPAASDVYQTDLWADEAIDFIEAAGDAPYFAMLSFNAPHNPLQAPQWAYNELTHIEGHERRTFYAMILALDAAIGRVLDAVEQSGHADDTIIIFSSDNGGADYTRIADSNMPYRGWKATFWEGGVRVPLLVRYPARVPAGLVIEGPASLLDLHPTLAGFAGAAPPEGVAFDGADLRGLLTAQTTTPAHQRLFWRNTDYFAVLDGRWKLHGDRSRDRIWLYDLEADPTEQNNVAEQYPEIVERLTALFAAHEAELAETPLWEANFLLPVFADDGAGLGDPLEDDDWIEWPG